MDKERAFVLQELFNIEDLGVSKPIQIRDIPLSDLYELEYHSKKFVDKFNRSKWIKTAIKHFNSHMRMIEEMDGKDPIEFFFDNLLNLMKTKPHRKDEIIEALQEFINVYQ